MKTFLALADAYCRLLQIGMLILLAIMLIGTLILIVGRYLPFITEFSWAMEVVEFSMIWLVFLGAAVAVREKAHFFVDLVPARYDNSIGRLLDWIYVGVVAIFLYVYIVYGSIYVAKWSLVQSSEILQLNLAFVYFSVPLCGVNSLLFFIAELLEKRQGMKNEVQP
jgi:TRAP-type C4-dicarboxylate transport system permease small subunit